VALTSTSFIIFSANDFSQSNGANDAVT
jgi:hypothetical protein